MANVTENIITNVLLWNKVIGLYFTACDGSCVTCSGTGSSACTACAVGKYRSATPAGSCLCKWLFKQMYVLMSFQIQECTLVMNERMDVYHQDPAIINTCQAFNIPYK